MSVPVATIQKIAKSKGLQFVYNEKLKCYTMLDRRTKDLLMEYANVTIALITSEKVWREECNKLKTSDG
jgi:hypothetical protein